MNATEDIDKNNFTKLGLRVVIFSQKKTSYVTLNYLFNKQSKTS